MRWYGIGPLLISLSLGLTACQTNMLNQFGMLREGMEKDDVLDIMGSPRQAQRAHGKDKWSYVFYQDRIRFEKEVQFFDGKAVYVGDVTQPPAGESAMEVDKRNEVANREVDAQIAQDIQKHRKDYENFESRARGEDKVRYVPEFAPVQ